MCVGISIEMVGYKILGGHNENWWVGRTTRRRERAVNENKSILLSIYVKVSHAGGEVNILGAKQMLELHTVRSLLRDFPKVQSKTNRYVGV